MQIIVLALTIGGGVYFLHFDRDSQVAGLIAALAPLGWLALFSLRYFTEKKKKKAEKFEEGPSVKKKFHDPNDLLKED